MTYRPVDLGPQEIRGGPPELPRDLEPALSIADHAHDWLPAGVVGIVEISRDGRRRCFVDLSATRDEIAVLALCRSCGETLVRKLDSRGLGRL